MSSYTPLTSTTSTTTSKPKTTTTNVSRSISTSDVQSRRYTLQEAQGLALTAFQNAIGRAPTSDELSAFLSALNAAEAKSPTVTSGSTFTSRESARTKSAGSGTADVTGSTSSSSTTSGGLDEQAFAQQYAMSLPGAAPYQKATRYFDLFNRVMSNRGM